MEEIQEEKKARRQAVYFRKLEEDGSFKVYTRSDHKLYSSGKYISATDQQLDGELHFYNKREEVYMTKKFDRGVEIRFPITTGDLNEPYDIIGLVSYIATYDDLRLFVPGFDKVFNRSEFNLVKECQAIGGDAIIGVRYEFTNPNDGQNGQLLMYGTAVKKRLE